eukprot:TRINITY_DN21289_c0_g1_i3.p1 TRINITY_DN21289_c0_g1~~TRINITY_DN21289_c0_g1_i3.p1  ORF type:complete len:297 (+),score=63.84 TRINITY_DN21289_c0_g1_i3:62-952(+)
MSPCGDVQIILPCPRRIDPAQPPLEAIWAHDWINLARRRLDQGALEKAIALAKTAEELDQDVHTLALEVLAQAEAASLQQVNVPGRGVLTLELWHESARAGSDLTGGVVWSGGELLAQILPRLSGLRGKRVLDLGSGTGVAGLAAAACGANVKLTDLPAAMPLLERNVARNLALVERAGGYASASVLDWSVAESSWNRQAVRYDVILGCDLVWKKEQCPVLVEWLAAAGSPCIFPLTPRTQRSPVREALERAWEECGFRKTKLEVGSDLVEVLLLETASTKATHDVSWLTRQDAAA